MLYVHDDQRCLKVLVVQVMLRRVVFVLLNKSDTPWSMSSVHESRAHLVAVHVMGSRAFEYKKQQKKEKQEALAF